MIFEDRDSIRILSTGEIIPPGKWVGRYEPDDDYIVYYTSANGRMWGTQSADIEIIPSKEIDE